MSMTKMAGQINPDAGIEVACSYHDGTVHVYSSKKENMPVRKFLLSKKFTTYGKGRLWCQTFEANNRKMKEQAG